MRVLVSHPKRPYQGGVMFQKINQNEKTGSGCLSWISKEWGVFGMVVFMGLGGGGQTCLGENLLQNGDFESGLTHFVLAPSMASICRENPHSGSSCLKITGPTRWKSFTAVPFEPAPNTTYVFSFWYRTENPSPVQSKQCFLPEQTYSFAMETREPGRDEAISSIGFTDGPSVGWRKRQGYFYCGNSPSLTVKFGITIPAGNVCIDDLQIEPITDKDFKGNLVPNGNFEAGECPNGWQASGGYHMEDALVPTYELDHNAGFIDGNRCLKIELKEGDAFVLSSGAFPIRAGKKYAYKVWLKSSVKSMPVTLWFASSNLTVGHWYKATNLTVDTNWQEYKFEATVPEPGASLYSPERVVATLVLRNDGIKERHAGALWLGKAEVLETQP